MGLNLPILKLGAGDIGLIPRHRAKTINSTIDVGFDYCSISKDVNGEYNLFSLTYSPDKSLTKEYYDGEKKILVLSFDSKNLQIKTFTQDQINLFFDVDVDSFLIDSTCAICIDGKIKVKSSLNIKAQALCCLDELVSENSIVLSTQQGIGLFAEANAQSLTITTGYLYTSSLLNIQQCDITAKALTQVAAAKINAAAFRLVAMQSELSGNITISDVCLITVGNLLIGDGINPLVFKIPANHYVHCINILFNKKSEFLIDESLKQNFTKDIKEKKFIVDEVLSINRSSIVKMTNSQLHINNIKVVGELNCNSCELEVNSIIVQKNKMLLADTKLIGRKITVFAGNILVKKNSQIRLKDKLLVDEKTNLSINTSKIYAANKITIFGCVDISRSEILTTSFLSYTKISIKKTKIKSLNNLDLQGNISLRNSFVKAKFAKFAGTITISDAHINAKDMGYTLQSGCAKNCFVRTNILSINGVTNENDFKFSDSRLVFNLLTIKNRVDVQSSSLVGVDDEKICHEIQGEIFLKKSQFITGSRLNSLTESRIKLCKHSKILSSFINSQGDICIDESTIYCDSLAQKGAAINSVSSKIIVKQSFISEASDITFSNGSQLLACNIRFGDNSSILFKGNSILGSKKQLLIEPLANITSKESIVCTDKFITLGKVEFIKSLLSSQDILVYNQFSAISQSVLRADKSIGLSEESNAKFESSIITSNNIYTFGQLDIYNSYLQTGKLSLWSKSTTNIQGQTCFISEDLTIRGTLVTKQSTKEKTEKDVAQTKLLMQAKNSIHISPTALISGNESLIIDADKITLAGKITLAANLYAKGCELYNIGSVEAKYIFLGFDDLVINHGTFSANSMTVHSSLVNVFGQIYALESLSCSGIIELNILGFISANNYINNSLISLNAGIIVPNLCASPEYIFSKSNLKSAAKVLSIGFFPIHAHTINLLIMIPDLFDFVADIPKLCDALDWQAIKLMRRHEYIPILCKLKNAAMLGHKSFTTINSFANEFSAISSNINGLITRPDNWLRGWESSLQSINWLQMSFRTAGALAGGYVDNSLLHINTGVNISAKSINKNLQHLNLGFEHSFFSSNTSTYSLYNTGCSSGLELSISTTNAKNSGVLAGITSFKFNAKKLDNNLRDPLIF